MTIDTLSSSSETITPSLYARGLPTSGAGAQPGSPTPRTPSIRHPWPPISLDLDPPEKGAKLLFTSAKTGEGVSEVFDYIARRTVKRLEWFEAYHRDFGHGPDGPFGEGSEIGFGRALGTERSSLAQFGTLTGKCC
jgi:Ras-related protein Rab-7A